MSTLRPYQSESLSGVREALTVNRRVILQQPTGGGKTRTAMELFSGEGPIWFVCHRRELVRQASKAMTQAGIEHAVAAPGHKRNYTAKVQVCSVGSMKRRMAKYPTPKRVVWDECRHIASPTWSRIQEALPSTEHIGLDATPVRTDGQGLHHWFDELVIGPSISELIAAGYLSTYRLFAPSKPDLSDVKTTRKGEYRDDEADKVMRDPRIVGDAVEHYQRTTPGKRAILFATSVAASEEAAAAFDAAGIPAKHVDGTTPTAERDQAVADLADGKILVLSNFGVFTEGFDVPAIDVVILLRPTKSLSLYLQMVGRGMRTADGKSCAFIMDHAGLVHEHGFPDAEIEWTLEGGAKKAHRKAAKRAPAVFTCPDCARAHAPAKSCPECGHKYPAAKVAQAIEGELEEQRAEDAAIAAEIEEKVEAERIIAEAMDTFVPVASFARIIHRTPSAVARLVLEGLPVNAEGEIQVSAGLAWVEGRPKATRAPRRPQVKVQEKRKRRFWFW